VNQFAVNQFAVDQFAVDQKRGRVLIFLANNITGELRFEETGCAAMG
jgi:hypothetical protein